MLDARKKDISKQDVISEPPSYKDDELLRFLTYKNPVDDLSLAFYSAIGR